MLRLDANAIILHPEADVILAGFGPNADARSFPRRGKLHRVIDQIGDRLGEERFVADDGQQWRLDGNFRRAIFDLEVLLHDINHQLVQAHRMQLHRGARNLAVDEHVAGETIHAGARTDDALEVVPAFVVELLSIVFQHGGGVALHGAKGRAQIVRDAVGKLLHLGDGLLKGRGPFADQSFQLRLAFFHGFPGLDAFRDVHAGTDITLEGALGAEAGGTLIE